MMFLVWLQEECKNNVISPGKLSSGYYEYDTETGSSYIIDKPEKAGKLYITIFHINNFNII